MAVAYVLNGKRLRSGPVVPALSPALAAVSDTLFVKTRSSVFGYAAVTEWLASRRIEALELAGIDGNCCVARCALDARALGISVCIDVACVGVRDAARFEKRRAQMEKQGVLFIPETA